MEKRTLTAEDILTALEADDPRAHINQRDERCCIVDGEFNLANIASLLNAKLAERETEPNGA